MHALVVDDSRATRAFLRKRLETLGFGVTEAGDGTEALDQLESTGPVDIALVDWNMPLMDGLDLVKAMRADRRYTEVPVMMITAESDPANMVRALMAGADEYAMKPIDNDGLVAKLTLLGVMPEAGQQKSIPPAPEDQ
jgi:two-component system chemotaxis response regulator CheY